MADLVAGVKKVVVIAVEHTAKRRAEAAARACTLPLTGAGVVDMLITDLAVFDIRPQGRQAKA